MKKIFFILAVLTLLGAVVWSTLPKDEEVRIIQVSMDIAFPGEEHSARVTSRIYFNSADVHEAVRIAEQVTLSEELTVIMLGIFLDGEMKKLYICSLIPQNGCVESSRVKQGQEALEIFRNRMRLYYIVYAERMLEKAKEQRSGKSPPDTNTDSEVTI